MSLTRPLNIIFAGTPEFAAKHLQALIDSPHRVVAVYTQPDRPAGRGKKLCHSPVKTVALEANIPVEQPESLKSNDAQARLSHYQPDLMVVVAYGMLLPLPILNTPPLGCINVHASLLPRWRGAAPIQRAIEAGDAETGITIMQMDVGLDTGDMLHKCKLAITATETGGSLHDKLLNIGPQALLETVAELAQGSCTREKQQHELATYAHKLHKHDALLDWNRPAAELDRKIRAFFPFPIAHTTIEGQALRIHQAHMAQEAQGEQPPGTILSHAQGLSVRCGDGKALSLCKLQLPGKKAMDAEPLLNGAGKKLAIGTVLGRTNT